MKKILFSLVIMLFIITGCENVNTYNNSNDANKNIENKATSSLKIDDIEVNLNRSSSFKKISYKYPENALASNLGTYAIMDLMNNDDLLVRVGLSFYENKTIEDVMQGTTVSYVNSSNINNNIWNIYEGIQTDGKNILNYVTKLDKDVYAITFISDKNINDFVNAFMNNIIFN